MKRLLITGLVALIFTASAAGAEEGDPAQAMQLLRDTPVSKLEYGLDRMQSGLEKRVRGLESHPAGPQRLSVYTRARKSGLFIGYSALYPKTANIRCSFVFELIKRKLGIASSKTPLQKSRAAEDLLEEFFLDPAARNLAANVEQFLTVYSGSYDDPKAEQCRGDLLSDRIEIIPPK